MNLNNVMPFIKRCEFKMVRRKGTGGLGTRGNYTLPHSTLKLGSLHTRAKSRDHTIVRAQKKSVQRPPQQPPKSCKVVTDSQV